MMRPPVMVRAAHRLVGPLTLTLSAVCCDDEKLGTLVLALPIALRCAFIRSGLHR